MASGCNWIDPAINVDPNAPSDAPYKTILPTAQVGLAYVFGGDYYRFTSLFTQHHFGYTRQHQSMYNYDLLESDLDNAWTTVYSGPLMDLKILIDDATLNKQYKYAGISQIMMAIGLGNTTDILGDIPYSAGFQGNDNLKPKYDSQQEIYNTIQKLLDDAIVNLSNTAENEFTPGTDDFVYQGDVSKWIKAAHSLKARYYLHAKDYANAQNEVAQGFSSNADDMLLVFGSSETNSNPFYQFMQQRGDISMGPKLMELLEAFNDPRIITFTSQDSVFDTSVFPDGFYTQANSPVPFITYAEIKFIEAECLFANDKNSSYQAYLDATKANLEFFGIDQADIDDYIANPEVAVGANNFTLENLINQKYIALYHQLETWTDWRRTGYPTLSPVKGNAVVRRMVYPQSERLYNNENLRTADGYTEITSSFIFSEMWWDRLW